MFHWRGRPADDRLDGRFTEQPSDIATADGQRVRNPDQSISAAIGKLQGANLLQLLYRKQREHVACGNFRKSPSTSAADRRLLQLGGASSDELDPYGAVAG